jgi:hypothetical protein
VCWSLRERHTECWFSVLHYINNLKYAEEKRAKKNKRIGQEGKKNIYLLQCSYVPPALPSFKGSDGAKLIPVAAQAKMWVCARSLAGIVGSIPPRA